MRLGQRRRDCHGLFRILACLRPCGLLLLTAKIPDLRPRFGTLCIGQGIIRIQPDRLVEVTNSLAIVFEIASLVKIMTQKISIMRFCVCRRGPGG